ncbi:MAG: type II toxin-antitoxin system VapC family toxin [Dehalococcoidia bacterium]
MKTAVDSNILFDLLNAAPSEPISAERVLAAASESGSIVLCPVVYAELTASFEHQQGLDTFLTDLGVLLEPFSVEALWRAGEAWRLYTRRRGQRIQCPRCGQQFRLQCPACQSPVAWRQHLISDFLIGGHALAQADGLITRDVGYYRTYFPRLRLIIPASGENGDARP